MSFNFELVSPEALLVSQPVALVTIPGGEGDYGVMAGHAPMITTVRPGVINIYADNDNTITNRLFVAGGFAEVTEDRCTLLAEEAVPVADIDRAAAETAILTAREALTKATSDTERAECEARLAVAEARVLACSAQ